MREVPPYLTLEGGGWRALAPRERELFIDNLLVRIYFIIVMIRWTGLAPWKCEFPSPGSLVSTFLGPLRSCLPPRRGFNSVRRLTDPRGVSTRTVFDLYQEEVF